MTDINARLRAIPTSRLPLRIAIKADVSEAKAQLAQVAAAFVHLADGRTIPADRLVADGHGGLTNKAPVKAPKKEAK